MTGYLLLGVLAVAGGYALLCAVSPLATCRHCTGSGRRRTRSGRAWRDCKPCRGLGKRIRTGRRIHTAGRRIHQEGNR